LSGSWGHEPQKKLQREIVQILDNIEQEKVQIENDSYGVSKIFSYINLKEGISTELASQLAYLKELRQAFLREAMQGKLVPQNPTEGKASDLFAQIKAEKAQLIKDKKLKKENPLPAIKPEEIPFEIPEIGFGVGWGIFALKMCMGLQKEVMTMILYLYCVWGTLLQMVKYFMII
jgi:restriction endonuclease S subunit